MISDVFICRVHSPVAPTGIRSIMHPDGEHAVDVARTGRTSPGVYCIEFRLGCCLAVRSVLIGVDCTGKQANGCACGVLDCLDSQARCRQSCCPGRSMLARRRGRSFTFVCQRVQSLTPQRMGPKMTATGTEEVNRVPRMGRPPGMWVT